jgi:hypothetical protein
VRWTPTSRFGNTSTFATANFKLFIISIAVLEIVHPDAELHKKHLANLSVAAAATLHPPQLGACREIESVKRRRRRRRRERRRCGKKESHSSRGMGECTQQRKKIHSLI